MRDGQGRCRELGEINCSKKNPVFRLAAADRCNLTNMRDEPNLRRDFYKWPACQKENSREKGAGEEQRQKMFYSFHLNLNISSAVAIQLLAEKNENVWCLLPNSPRAVQSVRKPAPLHRGRRKSLSPTSWRCLRRQRDRRNSCPGRGNHGSEIKKKKEKHKRADKYLHGWVMHTNNNSGKS